MRNTNRLLVRLKQLTRYWSVIKDQKKRREFFAEIALLNFNRLKYFGYFLLLMGIFQLFTDVFLSDFWETYQVSSFMILDITVVLSSLIILAISYINPPRTAADIKPWHKVYFYLYLTYHLLWSVAISVIEAKSANGVPTFLVGVFAAATIYLTHGIPFLLYLIGSLTTLFAGLSMIGVEKAELVNQYVSTVILALIAWIVSRVLMNTRKRSFLERKDIEYARDNLDHTVRERTRELQKANEQLLEEIKERQKYELSLKEEKKKAEEADRLKSVFLANMSHEIRTPLNGIIGFGDLLKNPDLTREKKERYLEIIGSNSQQLLKIIDDLMDISMIESNQLKLNLINFRIAQVLPDAEVLYNNYLEMHNKDHIRIINDGFSGKGDDTVHSDPARVQQVLYNLLGNAIKFTQEGHVRFGAHSEDGWIQVYVEDTGIGISPDKCTAIFQRFRQGEESTSRTYGGTGLGLSISKGIIDLLGGFMWVDLSCRKGARFCFSLPTTEIAAPSKVIFAASMEFLEERGLLLEQKGEGQPGFMDYLKACMGLQIETLPLDNFEPARKNDDPKVIIIDLQNTDPLSFGRILKPVLQPKDCYLITAIKPNREAKQSLLDMGCTMVFETPVNLALMLIRIKKEIYDLEVRV